MNLPTRRILGVGLISLGASVSSADTSNLISGIHAPADWSDGDGGCVAGEHHMRIMTARPLPWFDNYAISWRQRSNGCRSPVVDGFEATGVFKTDDMDKQGNDVSMPPLQDHSTLQLSLDVCAPYGYYELEIVVEGDNTESQDSTMGIQWEIDALSDEGRITTKWSGIAELTKQRKQSAWYVPKLRYTPPTTAYVWTVSNEAGYQVEQMWSGPEPQDCSLEFPKQTIPGTFDEGCYNYVDNMDIFRVVGAPSSGMTKQNCAISCQTKGYGYSATTNGKVCLCGDAAPRVKQALDSCGVPCAGDSRFECGGNGSNWYLTVVRLLDTPERLDSRSHHRTLMDDDKTVNALPAKTNVDKTAEEKVIGETKEIVVDDPVKDKVIAEEPKSTYMGCFAINKNSGVLGTHVNCNLEMSNKVCKDECLKLGLWYAATTLGTECYCGDKAPVWDTNEAFCELKCEDENADGKNCGGWGFMTVFELNKPVSTLLEPGSLIAKGNGVTYEGCYNVKQNRGVFNKFITSSEWMTNEKCQKKCREIQNWYSATTQGTDCYCGDKAPVLRTASHFCDLPCEDDKGKGPHCGGWGFMDVFHIEKPVGLPLVPLSAPDGMDDGVTYKGCYDVKENRDVLNKFVISSEWMTNEKCQKKCRELGKWYSATTRGRDCYCGDKSPVRRTASLYCDIPCEDGIDGKLGKDGKCGGWGFLTVYAITKPVQASPTYWSATQGEKGDEVSYKGCFDIEGNADAFNKFVTSSREMTNEICQTECREVEHWYSATTRGKDCYCADKAPVRKADDRFCEVPCQNGKGEGLNCGGWGFITVFHITKPVPAVPGWPSPYQETGGGVTYMGCYNAGENKKLFDRVVESSRWMTNEKCEKNCREIDYWYSATTDGTECYCGDKAPVSRTSDWYCDLPCEERGQDDKDPRCGGRGYLTVFQIHEFIPALTRPTPAGWKKQDVVTYKGCYDVKRNLDLFDKFATSSRWMTNEKCQTKCREIDYWYSATTDGTECYCGEKAPVERTSDWYCDLPCEEDGKYGNDPKCGGRGYLTVFHTSEAVPDAHSSLILPPKRTDGGVVYEGCYDVDDNSGGFNKLVKSSKWMTNKVCQDKCRDIQYEYSATTEGTECYCGNKPPVYKREAWKCKLPCEDGSDIKCGGWGFMSVFHLSNPVPIVHVPEPSHLKRKDVTYKGCYDVGDNSRIFTKFMKSSKWMTNEVCQEKCADLDHWYSATIEGTECYCGDEPPVYKTDDRNCKIPCDDDADIKCGGWGFMTVFEIHKPPPGPKGTPIPDNEDVPGAQAKGCFKDSTSKRVLGGHSYNSDFMTAKECGRVCKTKSHTVFGVEFSRECFCGDKVPAGDGKADKCDNRCTGDKTKVCGGRGRINVYEFTKDSSPSDGKHATLGDDNVDGAETLGCYEDSPNKRLLKIHSFDDKTKMTAQKCGDDCYNKGYKVFGTEFGRECFCGDDVPALKWKADKCDSECTGNKKVACGGHNRINLFKWDDSERKNGGLAWDTCNGASPLGCFKDNSRHRVLGGDKKDDRGMSAQVCGDFCKGKGYAFFGTQYSKECFCGYDFKSEAKVDDGECDYACAGKSSAACGGKNRVSVFKFNKGTQDKKNETRKGEENKNGEKKDEDKAEVVEPQPGNMLGCFKDARFKRVLNLTRDYKLDKMTPEKCYLHCKLHRAVYYGVEFGKECFCGDKDSKHDETPLDRSSCQMPCSGDHDQYCGGKNAINVYGPPRHH